MPIEPKERFRNQELLNELILELSEDSLDDNQLEGLLIRLKDIYSDGGGASGFRHHYSEFFPLVVEISQNDKYVFDYLLNNLDSICKHAQTTHTNTNDYIFLSSLNKLYDHLNLEIARFIYYYKNESTVKKVAQTAEMMKRQSEQVDANLNTTNERIRQMEEELQNALNKADSLQSEMIAVLSIFSAVVIAFLGGVNFITSAIANLNNVHIYKSAVIVLISGIVLFNCISVLMYLIARIIGKSIYSPCKTANCTCIKKCITIIRIKNRLAYIFWGNILFLALLLIICGLWLWVDLHGNIPL